MIKPKSTIWVHLKIYFLNIKFILYIQLNLFNISLFIWKLLPVNFRDYFKNIKEITLKNFKIKIP